MNNCKECEGKTSNQKFCSMKCYGVYKSKHFDEYKNKAWGRGHVVTERAMLNMREAKLKNPTKYWLGKKLSKAHNDKFQKGQRDARKRGVYDTKEYREKHLRSTLKALFERPTKLERQFIRFFKEHNLPFNYCGDGTLVINGRCPDFVENDGKKMVIEVADKFQKMLWDRRKYKSWQGYEKNRIVFFKNFGWKCLTLWKDELENNPENVLDEVNEFIGGKR